jgi:hypothetical protein
MRAGSAVMEEKNKIQQQSNAKETASLVSCFTSLNNTNQRTFTINLRKCGL